MKVFESLFTILSTIAILVAVLLFTYISLKWMGQKLPSQNTSGHIKVLDRMMLSRDKYLLLIKVAEKTMLVGVSTNSVEKICDIEDPEALLVAASAQPGSSFSDVLFETVKKKGISIKEGFSHKKGGGDE